MQRPDTLHLGTQYYRAPFPEQRYWEDDLKLMRDSGLDTVQLWVLWAWVEAEAGSFRWDDYDELIRLAEQVGLKLVLSTIAEIQPYWIFREVPGCELINHLGQPATSVNRGECHFGCTPGGCTDHPGVWERMSGFLRAVGERYVGESHLIGWDAWNELRWNIEGEGRFCYCPHTLARYHQWLEERYGSLDGLNAAWKRRYAQWDEVWPGRKGNLPYTDMMAFQHFLTDRANAHARQRYDLLKSIDPQRPVTVHGGQPSPGYVGSSVKWTALDRGNDFDFADHLDGVGCSSFPKWQGMDDADFAVRVEYVKSAARGKRVWLSEVQGGRASNGFDINVPVPARDQQRWIWNGFACGADTILFWCWRDEVFGRESAGFGIIGKDGLAEERLAELQITGRVIAEHGPLLAGYTPDPAEVGVLFSPQTYYYHWSQTESAWQARQSLETWCTSLVKQAIPYTVLEDAHIDATSLAGLKLIILPRCQALPQASQDALAAWTRAGGILYCESECAAFDPAGLYRYGEDRLLATLAGIVDVGRRQLDQAVVNCELAGQTWQLPIHQWLTPYLVPPGGRCHAPHADGSLLVEAPAGEGRVIACGSYVGDGQGSSDAGIDALGRWMVDLAGVTPAIRVDEPLPGDEDFIHLRSGMSAGRRLLFVFAPRGGDRVLLHCHTGSLQGTDLVDLRSGDRITPLATEDGHRLELCIPAIGFAVLAEAP